MTVLHDGSWLVYVTLTHDLEQLLPPAPELVLQTAQGARFVEAKSSRSQGADGRYYLFKVTASDLESAGLAIQEADGRLLPLPGHGSSAGEALPREALRAQVAHGIQAAERLAEGAHRLRAALVDHPQALSPVPDALREDVLEGAVRAQESIAQLLVLRARLQSAAPGDGTVRRDE